MQLPVDIGNELLLRLAFITAMIAVVVILARLAERFASRSANIEPARVYRIKKTIRRIAITVAAISTIVLLSPDVRGLLTVLTVVGAGLAIALREALLSVAGWIRLSVLSPYKIGDRIEVGGVKGDVIDIRVLRSSLMEIGGWVDADQSTGRVVHIPNSWIFEYGVYNYTRGFRFIWNEISLVVTFRSDWRAARDIMQGFAEESAAIVEQQAAEEIRRMSEEFLIHYSILTPFVYTAIVENGVKLTLRYLTEARKRRGTAHALTVSILDAFREHGEIEFSYPTFGITHLDGGQFGSTGIAESAPRP